MCVDKLPREIPLMKVFTHSPSFTIWRGKGMAGGGNGGNREKAALKDKKFFSIESKFFTLRAAALRIGNHL